MPKNWSWPGFSLILFIVGFAVGFEVVAKEQHKAAFHTTVEQVSGIDLIKQDFADLQKDFDERMLITERRSAQTLAKLGEIEDQVALLALGTPGKPLKSVPYPRRRPIVWLPNDYTWLSK